MISDEKLMAYADGELDAIERTEVEAALASDETLRAKLEAHRALSARFASAFDGALDEPVPARLLAAAQPQRVVDFAARREPKAKWGYREWGAMAASLAGGLIIGLGAMSGRGELIAATEDGLSARGVLQAALNTQLAVEDGGAVRVGLSFRNRDGEYCRTFALTQQDVAGLACREQSGWQVAMTSAYTPQGGDIRQAGSETPPEILAAVDAMIAGDVLDADAERAAREEGWR